MVGLEMYALTLCACISLSLAAPLQRFLHRRQLPPRAAKNGTVATHSALSPLSLQHHLLLCEVKLGDGRSFKALVDTGSGNLVVPSADCSSPGCRGRRGFESDEDPDGNFLAGATDLHLAFATGKLSGMGWHGKVCLGNVCGQAGFLVAAWESPEFARFNFDAILGLGPPRQALRPEFSVISAFAQQTVMPEAAFMLSLRSHGNSSLMMGSTGFFSSSDTHNRSLPPWLAADARHGEWAVHLSDIALDGKASGACGKQGCRAVLDSGCGGIALPEPALKQLERRLKLRGCTQEAIQELPTLGFVLGNGHTYEVRPDRYVEFATVSESDDLDSDNHDSAPHCRLLINPTGGDSTRTAILGLPFLLDRDIAFDQGRMRIGLADAMLGIRVKEESAT